MKKERGNLVKKIPKERFFHQIIYVPEWKISYTKQTLFIIYLLYIHYYYYCFLEITTKLLQFERKNNKQRKKMALFSPFISSVDVTSWHNVNSLMTLR